ncbi:hypothetical protein FRC06_003059 [Ceratobasidium sp. 370]|nr:hypothetical protein FRC06_003059 [Ceratobasidium sp. 370]
MTTIFGISGQFLGEEHDSTLKQPETLEVWTPTKAPHTTVEADTERIKDWLKEGAREPLHLCRVELEDVVKVETSLRAEGLKPRYDWYSNTKTAIFRMPSEIHECPGEWLCDQAPWLTAQLRLASRCGEPLVKSGGSSGILLPGVGRPCPDKRLNLFLDFGSKRVPIPYPRVVLETTYSQSAEQVLTKAWNYLFHSEKHIHAVIICDMSYGVSQKKDFWASISVWKREETGDIDEDWPLEATKHVVHEPLPQAPQQEEEEVPAEAPEEDQVGGEPVPSPVSSSETFATGDTTRVELPDRWPGTLGGRTLHIVRRSGPTCIVDERKGETSGIDATLSLEVYDFLRICPQHGDQVVPNDDLHLGLNSLRDDILATLLFMREGMPAPAQAGQSKKRAAEADVSVQPTPGPATTTRAKPPGLEPRAKRTRRS